MNNLTNENFTLELKIDETLSTLDFFIEIIKKFNSEKPADVITLVSLKKGLELFAEVCSAHEASGLGLIKSEFSIDFQPLIDPSKISIYLSPDQKDTDGNPITSYDSLEDFIFILEDISKNKEVIINDTKMN